MGRTAKIILAVTALALIVASSAIAGNQKSSSSISLVLVPTGQTASAAAAVGPRYGDQVTFDVQTTATDRPYVLVNCYQNGVWVLAGQAGFYDASPFGRNFTMSAPPSWTGGEADCTARLGSLNADGSRFHELASTSFHVSA